MSSGSFTLWWHRSHTRYDLEIQCHILLIMSAVGKWGKINVCCVRACVCTYVCAKTVVYWMILLDLFQHVIVYNENVWMINIYVKVHLLPGQNSKTMLSIFSNKMEASFSYTERLPFIFLSFFFYRVLYVYKMHADMYICYAYTCGIYITIFYKHTFFFFYILKVIFKSCSFGFWFSVKPWTSFLPSLN